MVGRAGLVPTDVCVAGSCMSTTRCRMALDKAGDRFVTSALLGFPSSRTAGLGAAAGLELTTWQQGKWDVRKGGRSGRCRGRGKEVGGTQGRGRYMRGQRGGDLLVREEGSLHLRSVALPSYKSQKKTLNHS